ncbi:RT0821/Lpp0805 family surface protein [Geminicoccaceae bacterium 1502E]|nr:RT0821/Lpp0805 family surface protein [Geminicoccaceae bacterium 1502E]
MRGVRVLLLGLLLAACATAPDGDLVYNRLGPDEAQRADGVLQRALENYPSGRELAWRDPTTGVAGSVVPLRSFRTRSGRICREFVETVALGSVADRYRLTGCRDEAGIWRPR